MKANNGSGYRDLEIDKISYDLAVKVHELSLKLPKYEMFEEGSQLRRSSKGITARIVEGYGRKRYKAEFIKISGLCSCALNSIYVDKYCKRFND